MGMDTVGLYWIKKKLIKELNWWDTWLAQLKEQATLDLRDLGDLGVMSSSHRLGVEITSKKRNFFFKGLNWLNGIGSGKIFSQQFITVDIILIKIIGFQFW